MNCLIVASKGMLGQRLSREARARGWSVSTVARAEADFSLDLSQPESLLSLEKKIRPDIVVNCAALTDLDECERNWEKGRLVNAEVPKVLATLCARWNSYFIQVSTDHFFTGDGRLKHRESDPVTILNNYAKAKLLGERSALSWQNSLVVRTNIMGFRLDTRKNTLIEWMLSQLLQENEMTGFSDFFTSGMSVGELARVLCDLAARPRPVGRWNIAGREVFSKLDVILAAGREFGLRIDRVKPVSLATFSGARRAESLGLDSSRIEKLLGRQLPNLAETVRELHDEFRRSDEIREFLLSRRA